MVAVVIRYTPQGATDLGRAKGAIEELAQEGIIKQIADRGDDLQLAERASEVFRTTTTKTDVTGRTFGIKEIGMMGCTLMGVTLMVMMASFPHVQERVGRFDQELVNLNGYEKSFR